MDPATSKFEQALPLVLLPISTQLAALHTARTSQQSPPHACSRCGSELAISTRVKRSRSTTHLLHTVCGVCGGSTSITLAPSTAREFPSWRKLAFQATQPDFRSTQAQVHSNDKKVAVSLTPSLAPKPAAVPHPGQGPKPKKKPGLQEMLQRNRDKAKTRTQKEETKQAGLSAFLSTL